MSPMYMQRERAESVILTGPFFIEQRNVDLRTRQKSRQLQLVHCILARANPETEFSTSQTVQRGPGPWLERQEFHLWHD